MMRLVFYCLLALLVASISGCEEYSEVGIEQLDKYIEDSSSNSFHVWYLESEDQSFYYLRRKTGFASFDYFKLRKEDVSIEIKEELPAVLKFSDIKMNR